LAPVLPHRIEKPFGSLPDGFSSMLTIRCSLTDKRIQEYNNDNRLGGR